MRALFLTIFIGCISISAADSLSRMGGFTSPAAGAGNWVSPQVAAQRQSLLNGAIPKDPWRIIEGKTNYAKGPGWVMFSGKVFQQIDGGIIIDGAYSSSVTEGSESYTGLFFVSGMKTSLANGEIVHKGFDWKSIDTAKMAGTYTYPTLTGNNTIRRLEYGTPWTPPEGWADEIKAKREAAAKEKADAKKTKAEEAALKFNQTQAEKGDAQGLFRMGERYRDGDGVEPDPAKARDHFQRAQAAGHPDAAKALAELVESP